MVESGILIFLAYGLYLAWLAAGAGDFYLHRRSDLPATSGLRESALHGAQLACVGMGVLAWLSLPPNRLVGLSLVALAIVHAAMAYRDTCSADGVRRITPLEQHVHSMLDACPWVFAVGICASSEAGWQWAWRPRDAHVWVALVGPAAVLVILPWLLEFTAAMKYRRKRARMP
ncbi:hypothetical protein [Stenotrophomonas rhizophila]|uniref:hypothetical protein n=1 Tax=Stenotrophomonas rhizophila TaxID=216778 RepID=UPI001E53D9C4|nr:hypothetical protein [Stenotrophomonas rhizophila]MCC7633994.1 hypothetical protein [Stenotrophomonas rhizophila]MCC7663328.1 hypothetical protein [Stenotrophomonas rhizophila]